MLLVIPAPAAGVRPPRPTDVTRVSLRRACLTEGMRSRMDASVCSPFVPDAGGCGRAGGCMRPAATSAARRPPAMTTTVRKVRPVVPRRAACRASRTAKGRPIRHAGRRPSPHTPAAAPRVRAGAPAAARLRPKLRAWDGGSLRTWAEMRHAIQDAPEQPLQPIQQQGRCRPRMRTRAAPGRSAQPTPRGLARARPPAGLRARAARGCRGAPWRPRASRAPRRQLGMCYGSARLSQPCTPTRRAGPAAVANPR
jgi:hypothetical protein